MADIDAAKFNAWVLRIFGSFEEYERSLPARIWFQTLGGKWGSTERVGR